MTRDIKSLALGGAAIAALAVAAFAEIPPLLVWNVSASAPQGLYRVERRRLERGDYALVKSSEPVRSLITKRGYLPPAMPLVKRVAALEGAQVCRRGERILIDEIVVAYALNADSLGRTLPLWEGCVRLKDAEVFLLNDHEKSLDGRYFGATKAEDAIGVARPLWIIKSAGP